MMQTVEQLACWPRSLNGCTAVCEKLHTGSHADFKSYCEQLQEAKGLMVVALLAASDVNAGNGHS